MKAPNFRYARPASLQEAFHLMEEYGEGAAVLAGGQSLLAGLSMRLSAPEILVDIGDIAELGGISLQGGEVVIGALARHSEVLDSPLVGEYLPLLAAAIRHVGHVAIRNRGTFGGSLAYADPAAEIPACAVALDATLVLGGRNGRRLVRAEEFFTGLLQTDLRPGELVIEARIPVQRDGRAHGFAELSRRQGDFALVGMAAVVRMSGTRIDDARLVYLGCVERAMVAHRVGMALAGRDLPVVEGSLLSAALREDLDPVDSAGLRADTKLRIAEVLTCRVLNSLRTGHSAVRY